MNKKWALIPLLLSAICLGSHAEPKVKINLFPKQPLETVIMADSNFRTQIEIPIGLEEEVLTKSLDKFLPYASIGGTLPLVSVKALDSFVYLVTGGQLNFSKENKNIIDYKVKLEIDFNTLSRDNHDLWFSAGIKGKGSANSKEFDDAFKIPGLFIDNLDEYNFFINAYLVPNLDRGNLIMGVGVDNLLGNTSEKIKIPISVALKFPPIFKKRTGSSEASLYVSTQVIFPISPTEGFEFFGQAGVELKGKTGDALCLYGQLSYNKELPFKVSSGIKIGTYSKNK
ncbi:MAG: hypothetical protein Q7S06_00085 [Nanoarchaeota archaeon]|nr:hypothetical protein [Nanoarchaeota archaeon]